MINLTNEQIMKEIQTRIDNACSGFNYESRFFKKVLKITLNQCFIDGLLAIPPTPGKPLMLPGSIHNIKLDIKFEC